MHNGIYYTTKHQNQAQKKRNSEELKLNKQIQSIITIQMEKLKTLRKTKTKEREEDSKEELNLILRANSGEGDFFLLN